MQLLFAACVAYTQFLSTRSSQFQLPATIGTQMLYSNGLLSARSTRLFDSLGGIPICQCPGVSALNYTDMHVAQPAWFANSGLCNHDLMLGVPNR
ncbi:hypothetical protein BDD12DRAFT_362482 [Trichophaea hybrida]|nr:hypothetical protein BDD12DRAFT_362482 [Trichophaea hybrida]